MLLYVNKKKQRQKKIKYLCLIITCSFIVVANILYFNKSIHHTEQTLTQFEDIKTTQNWFSQSDTITIFTKKDSKNPEIIIIPENITKENLQTFTFSLTKVIGNPQVQINLPNTQKEIIKNITYSIITNPSTKKEENLIITNNITNLKNIIQEKKLFPKTLNFKSINKKLPQPSIDLINTIFPKEPTPTNNLEEEYYSLDKFASIYKKELINVIKEEKTHNFSSENLFLKNANICIKSTKNNIYCSINKNNSFKRNIYDVLRQKSINEKISILYLLTSFEEIEQTALIDEKEGIIFIFNNRQKLLLPENIQKLNKKQSPFLIAKKQLGINYNYNTTDMKFYKFKTKEIVLNDNI